ncbi:MAG TPA: acyl-CoA dehydrogenase family protein [Pilimelia sp.]|nr:acyl-CoA dehydrogenase family protein [Pilimelia sp.]
MIHETLSSVRELSGVIAKRAEEIENSRQLPGDLVAALTATGCFRMLAPARHGGDELPMSRALPVMAELAKADPSVGWVVGQVALSQLIVGCCPPRAVDEAYAGGPDLLAAGAVAPKGRASANGDGWRVSGQWPFVTGCAHASWFYLNCVEMAGRNLGRTPDGMPQTRIVLLPASDVVIEDTWRVVGLRGTGSSDVRVSGVAVPAYRGFTLTPGDPAAAVAAARIARSSLIIAAVVTGIAEGALDDILALAGGGKRPALSAQRLSRSPLFQDRLGEAHMLLRSAKALLAEQARDSDDLDAESSPRQRAELRATAAQVTGMASQVVDAAYTLGGGSALYDTSPLQRRLRDMRAATQHFVAGRQSYQALGALLVGEEPEIGMF